LLTLVQSLIEKYRVKIQTGNLTLRETLGNDQHSKRRPRSFSKTLFKSEEFENAGFAFSYGQKHFENKAYQKQ